MHSVLLRENELQAEHNRALWNPIISLRDEERDRADRSAEKAVYAPTRALVMSYQESERSRVRSAWTRAAFHVSLGWLAAIYNTGDKGVSPCHFSETGGKLLGTECGAETQTGHDDFVVRSGESPG